MLHGARYRWYRLVQHQKSWGKKKFFFVCLILPVCEVFHVEAYLLILVLQECPTLASQHVTLLAVGCCAAARKSALEAAYFHHNIEPSKSNFCQQINTW